MKRDLELEAVLVRKYASIWKVLDKGGRRLWAPAKSNAIGYGGYSVVSSATGLARETISNGRAEIAAGVQATGRIRKAGGGRRPLDNSQPGLEKALEQLVSPETRGDPMSPLRRWREQRVPTSPVESRATETV